MASRFCGFSRGSYSGYYIPGGSFRGPLIPSSSYLRAPDFFQISGTHAHTQHSAPSSQQTTHKNDNMASDGSWGSLKTPAISILVLSPKASRAATGLLALVTISQHTLRRNPSNHVQQYRSSNGGEAYKTKHILNPRAPLGAGDGGPVHPPSRLRLLPVGSSINSRFGVITGRF